MRKAVHVSLTYSVRAQLLRWARGRRTPVQLAERARLILLAADGLSDIDIAAAERCDRRTVARWRRRFVMQGLAGIERDAPRPDSQRRLAADMVHAIVRRTVAEAGPDGRRWSARSMARAAGVSEASVRRIWRAHGIAPHEGAARHGEYPPVT